MLFIIFLALIALVAWFLVHYFVTNDRGTKEPATALWVAAGFGVLAIILASTFNSFIPESLIPVMSVEPDEQVPPEYPQIIYGMLLVGLIEETVKFLPLALFLRKKPYFNEMTDGVIYFGIVGLVFSVLEDIAYAGSYGGATGIFRIFFGLFLHTGFTIIVGLAFARYILKKKSIWTVLVALLTAIMVHALYNIGVSSQVWILVLVSVTISIFLNVSIFRWYRSAQKLDEAAGLSAIGTNKFCRQCGAQNPRRMLYCERCGKLA